MKLYCRTYQFIFRCAAALLPWRMPTILSGDDVYEKVVKNLDKDRNVLIISDKQIISLGLLNKLLHALEENKIKYFIYDKTTPNPTIDNIEEALSLYKINSCKAIIALGGGSVIDCAKGVGARSVKKHTKIEKMKGLLKVRRHLPPIFAIPTTAGTGSETTVASVISNAKTHEKYAISDVSLIPKFAVFDTELTKNLPPQLTATTGMDALTHAVEAFIGRSNTKQTRKDALKAVKLIDENLLEAYLNGKNMIARENMQFASFFAGRAFTRAYVGNVHAIAHALGALYNIPHGLANAIVLPVVLRAYNGKVNKELAILADHIHITKEGDLEAVKAEKFILYIESLLYKMKIPTTVKELQEKDIKTIAMKAEREANPTYPVPVIWSLKEFETVIIQLAGEKQKQKFA